MSHQLLRGLDLCRRRIEKLAERHLGNAIHSGWFQWAGGRPKEVDEQVVVWRLTGQPCHLTGHVSMHQGNHWFFFHLPTQRGTHGSSTLQMTQAQFEELNPIAQALAGLCEELHETVRNRLRLPNPKAQWWQLLHHLAWHFPQSKFLDASRQRLLCTAEFPQLTSDERVVQLFHENPTDVFPGLIFSMAESDAYTMSLTAIDLIEDHIQKEMNGEAPAEPDYTKFARLRDEFSEGGWAMDRIAPRCVEFKVIKCDDSFRSPPASEWAAYSEGGCVERKSILSVLNCCWEFAWLRGSCAKQVAEMSERAGNLLPEPLGHEPIMFCREEVQEVGHRVAHCGQAPVTNRDAMGRWIGHVLATLKRHRPELVETSWRSPWPSHLLYGFTTLKVNVYEASALAIELSGLSGDIPPPFTGVDEHGILIPTKLEREPRANRKAKQPPPRKGRTPLSQSRDISKRLRANIYQLILKSKKAGVGPKALLPLVKAESHIVQQAKELGETLNESLIRNALAYERRERKSKRHK